MIIPIRCFECGKVLAHLWEPYQKRVDELKVDNPSVPLSRIPNMVHMVSHQQKTPQATALDELGLHRYCCRTAMLGCVDLTNTI